MTVAFPFIEVNIDTSGLVPVAERAPGVIAVVGESNVGTAAVGAVVAVDTAADVNTKFGTNTRLGQSLKLALLQDPRPSKVYGVKANGSPPTAANYAEALTALEAADDVTFVSLANEPVNLGANTSPAATGALAPLKAHCEAMSSEGQKRIGVAMVNPAMKASDDAQKIIDRCVELKSSSSRMVMIAGRGATVEGTTTPADAATASMAAFAGYQPQVSLVLKRVRGVRMPVETQFTPSEITALSEEEIIPIIDPALIPGESLHFAEARAYTTDTSLLYIDIVRVLDDIDFRLKAGLVGVIGDARITKAGLSAVKARTEGILGPLQQAAVIDAFAVTIPVLDILFIPQAARTPADQNIVAQARAERQVDLFVEIEYGPATHHLVVHLTPTF
jgi:hypothetical protein